MLAEILETQGLEMSATYFIYAILDFKVAIRDSFLSHFSNIEAKGCSFHFRLSSRRFPIMVSSLTIQTRTASHSLHLFEQSWDCAMFLSYVQGRYLQSLPFVQMINYMLWTWVNGSFPPSSWVMYNHQGEGISWRKMMPSRPLWGSWRRRTLLPFKSFNDVPKYNFLIILSY